MLTLSLSLVLKQVEGLEVIGTSALFSDLVTLVVESKCDTVLVSLRLRNTSGLDVVRKLRTAGITACIILLGCSLEVTSISDLHLAGADSFLSISCTNDEIISCIKHSLRAKAVADFRFTGSADKLPLT